MKMRMAKLNIKIHSANAFNDEKSAKLINISTFYTSSKYNVQLNCHKRYQTEFCF